MAQVRLLNHSEIEEAVRLSDSIFRDSEQKSMGDAFPFIFSESIKQSFGAFEDNKLVSFIGLVPATMQINGARLNVYSLGSVCTHPDFRNKGYAGQILNTIKKHINKAGASLLLVSGDRSLYIRNHCFPFGCIHQFTLRNDQLKSHFASLQSNHLQIRELESTDWFKLFEAASARTVRYEQSISDLPQLIHAEAYGSCLKLVYKVLVADNNTGSVDFVVIAIPNGTESNTPFIVERAGEAKTIKALLNHALKRYNLSQLDIPVAWHETELISELQGLPEKTNTNGGTIHIVNLMRLIKQLQPLIKQQQKIKFHPLQDGSCNIILNDEQSMNLKPDDLVSLIFNPQPSIEMDKSLRTELSKIFPIPFPCTYGLNYV